MFNSASYLESGSELKSHCLAKSHKVSTEMLAIGAECRRSGEMRGRPMLDIIAAKPRWC
jgi:hypothetical protein